MLVLLGVPPRVMRPKPPGPRVSGVRGYLGCACWAPPALRPPINGRQVGDELESMCLQVTTMEMLLHATLASVHQNILCLIQVTLKREKILPHSSVFLHAL
jgi:hypothetical protein